MDNTREALKQARESFASLIEFTKPLNNFNGYTRLAMGPTELIKTVQDSIANLDEALAAANAAEAKPAPEPVAVTLDIKNKEALEDWLFEHAQIQGHVCEAVKAPLLGVSPGDSPAELYNVAWIDKQTGERFDVVYAALPAPMDAQPTVQAQAIVWAPGPNEWKDWCSQYFGLDSDDAYLAKAVFNLPPMAQKFARSVATPVAQDVQPSDSARYNAGFVAGQRYAEKHLAQPLVSGAPDEREAYEMWAHPDSAQARRNEDGSYQDYGMAAGWSAWQARATIAAMSHEALTSVTPGIAKLMPTAGAALSTHQPNALECSSDLSILRRIAERGMKLALSKDSDFVDLFQHLLDEISRCGTVTQVNAVQPSYADLEEECRMLSDRLKLADEALAEYEAKEDAAQPEKDEG